MVVLKNRAALERNGLQEGTKPLKRRRCKTGQQAVLDPNRLLAVGTAQRTFQRYPMELSSICVPIGPCSASIRTSSPPSYSLFDLESLHPDNPAAPAQGTSNFPNAQSIQYCPLASLISVIET